MSLIILKTQENWYRDNSDNLTSGWVYDITARDREKYAFTLLWALVHKCIIFYLYKTYLLYLFIRFF